MSEERAEYDAGQINRLQRIEHWLERDSDLPLDDQKWLIAEVKRLQEALNQGIEPVPYLRSWEKDK